MQKKSKTETHLKSNDDLFLYSAAAAAAEAVRKLRSKNRMKHTTRQLQRV